MIITVCHWLNGCYVNTWAGAEYDKWYQDLVDQFGPPAISTTELREE